MKTTVSKFLLVGVVLAAAVLIVTYLLYRWFRFTEEQKTEREIEKQKTQQKLFDDEDL